MPSPRTEMIDLEIGKSSSSAGGHSASSSKPLATTVPVHLPDDPPQGRLLKPIPENTREEKMAAGVAVVAVVTSVAAMAVEQTALVIVGGLLSIIMGPYVYWQQTRLTDIRALKETKLAVQHEVDKLAMENKRLASSIDDMAESIQKLQDVEIALESITNTQNKSVAAFRQQVQENKALLAQMESNLKANVLQNLLSVVLRADTDQDLKISAPELEDLLRKLRNLHGVTIHEDRFRAAMTGQSIANVMEIIKNLLLDDEQRLPTQERIFELAQ